MRTFLLAHIVAMLARIVPGLSEDSCKAARAALAAFLVRSVEKRSMRSRLLCPVSCVPGASAAVRPLFWVHSARKSTCFESAVHNKPGSSVLGNLFVWPMISL
eukprot:5377231-Pyramimonas_sp.AAC.1